MTIFQNTLALEAYFKHTKTSITLTLIVTLTATIQLRIIQ